MNDKRTIQQPEWAAFSMGTMVFKASGSNWRGRVVGYYSTELNPYGIAVESDTEKGSVQIYPQRALKEGFEWPDYPESDEPVNIGAILISAFIFFALGLLSGAFLHSIM